MFCPESLATRANRTVLSRDCPFCHASEALIIVGARASSLLSVVLGQTFASRQNDDSGGHAEPAQNFEPSSAQKVISFSDNVQDAAHRAGFFSAHTWQNNVRTAVVQAAAAQQRLRLRKLGAVAAGRGRGTVPGQLPAYGGLVDAHALGDLRLLESACLESPDVASLPVGELAVWHGHSPFAVKG